MSNIRKGNGKGNILNRLQMFVSKDVGSQRKLIDSMVHSDKDVSGSDISLKKNRNYKNGEENSTRETFISEKNGRKRRLEIEEEFEDVEDLEDDEEYDSDEEYDDEEGEEEEEIIDDSEVEEDGAELEDDEMGSEYNSESETESDDETSNKLSGSKGNMQHSSVASWFFPLTRNNDVKSSISTKMKKLKECATFDIYGNILCKSDVLTEDEEEKPLSLVPCGSLSELNGVYNVKIPKLFKITCQNAFHCQDTTYFNNVISALSMYCDVFVDGTNDCLKSGDVDSVGEPVDELVRPIIQHMICHVMNAKVIQSKHNAKIKASLLKEQAALKEQHQQAILSKRMQEAEALMGGDGIDEAESYSIKKNNAKKERKMLKREIQKRNAENAAAAAMKAKDTSDNSLPSIIEDEPMASDDTEDSYLDQGFTKPRILILCAFRHTAYNLVHNLIDTLNNACSSNAKESVASGPTSVANYDKFEDEYSFIEDEDDKDYDHKKPLDWKKQFHQKNVDDDFKFGIQFNPGQGKPVESGGRGVGLRLFSEFYASDIIVGSPLGLRFVIENSNQGIHKGNKKQKPKVTADFLSSIEIALVYQGDVLYMQNWDHVEYILKHTNQLPGKSSTDIDYARVRPYFLDGHAMFHRQLIITSAFNDCSIQSTFRKYTTSIAGTIRIRLSSNGPSATGTNDKKIQTDGYISEVTCPVNQIFQCIPCNTFAEAEDKRFSYFKEYILTPMLRSQQPHTLIVAPSYLHYVRIRNELMRRNANAAFVCEYSRDSEISRGRSRFLHGQNDILLYSGRAHFFRRFKIRGAINIVFYSLPEYAHFYSEFVNMLEDPEDISSIISERLERSRIAAQIRAESKPTPLDMGAPTSGGAYTSTSAAKKKKGNKARQKRLAQEAAGNLLERQVATVNHSPEEISKMNHSCIALFTEYERMALERIVGHKRCSHMLSSGKSTFMFR